MRFAARLACSCVGLVCLSASSGHSWAQEEAPEEQETPETPEAPEAPEAESVEVKPWNAGVSDEQKKAAQAYFDAGNKQFERSQYGNALKEYRKAIELRDHPAIRYNMAVCLIHLDQILEAHRELSASLRYGSEPLGGEAFKEGQTYMKLLLGRLAEIKVRTKEVDARVTLNGELLFVGPGEVSRLVLPTKLQIIATKPDRLPLTTELVPIPGELNDVSLEMRPLSEGLVYRRRWARWKPWAVVAGGAGMALLGVPVLLGAGDKVESYDREVARICPEGCANGADDLPDDVNELRDAATFEQTLSTGLFVIGGAAVVTGMALVWLNQPKPVHDEESLLPINVAPVPGGAVGSYSMTF